MKRHTELHKLRRTQKRGLRPYSGSGVELFSPDQIKEMGEKIRKILANCSSSKEIRFLLGHIRLVCLFRQAREDTKKRDHFLRQINKSEAKAEGIEDFNFSAEQLRTLNRWVLDQELAGRLDWLLQQIDEKLRRKK